MIKLDVEDVLQEIEDWLILDCIEENESPEEDFFVEKFEHAAIVRWGSKRGDFPRLGHSILSDTHSVILSGEMIDDNRMIADLDSKFEIDIKQHAYRYFLEVLMRDFEDGYELNGIEAPNGDLFKISVEKLKTPKPEEKS